MSHLSPFRKLVIGTSLCLSAVMLSATQASAFTYKFGGTSASSNTTATGASASVDINFADLGNGQVKLNLGFLNTTGTLATGTFGAGATDARLNGIALDLFDNITIASHSFDGKLSTLFTNFAYSPFSNSVGNFSVGFGDNNQFEGGKAKDGLAVGETSFATLVLNSNKNAADLENQFRLALTANTLNIAARFQAVNAGAGSDKLLGGSIDDPFTPPTPTEVPEPAAIAGLGHLAACLKRRRPALAKTLSA